MVYVLVADRSSSNIRGRTPSERALAFKGFVAVTEAVAPRESCARVDRPRRCFLQFSSELLFVIKRMVALDLLESGIVTIETFMLFDYPYAMNGSDRHKSRSVSLCYVLDIVFGQLIVQVSLSSVFCE